MTFDPTRHTIIHLGCPPLGARGIYAAIIAALGGTPCFHYASLIPAAQAALAHEREKRGRRVVLIIDEAHVLDDAGLEEPRMLTNAEMDSR